MEDELPQDEARRRAREVARRMLTTPRQPKAPAKHEEAPAKPRVRQSTYGNLPPDPTKGQKPQ